MANSKWVLVMGINLSRRLFVTRAAAFIAAPAIVRVVSLMPISVLPARYEHSQLTMGFTVTEPGWTAPIVRMFNDGMWLRVGSLDTPSRFKMFLDELRNPENVILKPHAIDWPSPRAYASDLRRWPQIEHLASFDIDINRADPFHVKSKPSHPKEA